MCACERKTPLDYTVVGQSGWFSEGSATFDFGREQLVSSLSGPSYEDPQAPETRTLKILDQEYTVQYIGTDVYPTQDRYFDTYAMEGYTLGGVSLTYNNQTDNLRSLSFYDDAIEKPKFSVPVTPESVRAFFEKEVLAQGVSLKDWDETCRSSYTVSYQLFGETREESGSEDRFLDHAPLPAGATLLEEKISYSFAYELKLGRFQTSAVAAAQIAKDGTLKRLESYDTDLYGALSKEDVNAVGLEQSCITAVRGAYKNDKHGIASVDLGQMTLRMDLDGKPYYEVSVGVEYQDEDQLLCDCQNDLILKVCRSDILESKAALRTEYARELAELTGDYEAHLDEAQAESASDFTKSLTVGGEQ